MSRTSEAYRREHAITRAWQRHGVELNGAGYDALVAQVRRYGAAICVRREQYATHHCVFIQRKALVIVWDERQHRIKTVLPKTVRLSVAMRVLRSRVVVTRRAVIAVRLALQQRSFTARR